MEYVIACVNDFGDRNIHLTCDNAEIAEAVACELSLRYSRFKWCVVCDSSDTIIVYELGDRSEFDVGRAE